MNRNHFWKFLFVVLVLAWSLYEIYPPTDRDLIQYFETRAQRGTKDETFNSIVERAKELQKERPDLAYGNLRDAVGTNDIARYFPFFDSSKEREPTFYILNRLQREAAGKIRLGIDLAGGTAFVVELDTNHLAVAEVVTNNVTREIRTNMVMAGGEDLQSAIDQAISVLRARIDRFGVAEPVFQPEGADRIRIELPGLSESVKSNAIETLKRPAFLEFKIVHERSKELLASGIIPPAYEVLSSIPRIAPDGTRSHETNVVRRRPEMTGGIKRAFRDRDDMGRPQISFTLDAENTERFAEITRENQGRKLAIVLDGELHTAPTIETPIEHGNGRITGHYTDVEAANLANVLSNPLKTPIRIMSQTDVDPTLGQDSIQSGIRAAIYGVVAVSLFMLIYYLVAGAVANVALVLNVVILLGVMCSIGTTFTLPGIAGVVLTIGMAVDANVLIYERIREELAAGKSLRGALNSGYDKAFGTIFDTNITTLISSVILVFMGTGPVKGFGMTLTIGIAASMFTALVVTRLIFDFLVAKNILKTLKMVRFVKGTKFDFMRWAVPAFCASWLLILIGNGYGLFVRGTDVLGVEFTGGESITLGFNQSQKKDIDQIRPVVDAVVGGGALINYQRDIGAGTDSLRITVRAAENRPEGEGVSDSIIAALRNAFPEAQFESRGVELVGPRIGEEIQRNAVIASLLAMFGILLYVAFRYEFSFAVGAVVAILHDILMTSGWYFLAQHQLNATTVAAFLTIIGFSINDTIVIFDRIREDLKLGVRGSFKDVMNKALNQTLSRTIITSGTTFLATLALYIFGGGPINDFAFAFLIGILTGTYSSIYIACFIVLRWHKGQRPRLSSSQMEVGEAAAAQG